MEADEHGESGQLVKLRDATQAPVGYNLAQKPALSFFW